MGFKLAEQGKKGGKKSGQKNGLLYRQGYIMRETIKRFTYWEFVCNRKNYNNIQFENTLKLMNFIFLFMSIRVSV